MQQNPNSKKIDKENGTIRKIIDWSMKHFFITFILFYLSIATSIYFDIEGIPIILGIILALYTIVYLSNNVKVHVNKFLHHELSLRQILIGYIVSVLSIVMLFAITYWAITTIGLGYVTYGDCHEIDLGNIDTNKLDDEETIHNMVDYGYFSSVTFFTVGYGDICPMGLNKFVSILNAMIGNLFTVIILAIAITNYNKNN
jgi:hypothetical protein